MCENELNSEVVDITVSLKIDIFINKIFRKSRFSLQSKAIKRILKKKHFRFDDFAFHIKLSNKFNGNTHTHTHTFVQDESVVSVHSI